MDDVLTGTFTTSGNANFVCKKLVNSALVYVKLNPNAAVFGVQSCRETAEFFTRLADALENQGE